MDITTFAKSNLMVMKVGATESTVFKDFNKLSVSEGLLTIDNKVNGKSNQTFYPLSNISWFRVVEE